jgi:FKBP-type peptidyl-prolyl cis-trans isomerase FklB
MHSPVPDFRHRRIAWQTRNMKSKNGAKLMKNMKWSVACGLLIASTTLWAAEAVSIKTDKDKLSYSIGASIGKNLKSESAEIDVSVMIEGIKASLSGDKSLLTEKEIRQVMGDYQTQLRQRAQVKKQLAIVDNKKKGDTFLASYKAQTGVQALPNGVLYKVLREGQGRKPMESDMVEVNYRGALTNGAEFDATEPGKPANLKVSSLIVGWKQALSVMPVGSKWQIVIPAELAYGERGVGSDIGPNEVLVFDLELLAIK